LLLVFLDVVHDVCHATIGKVRKRARSIPDCDELYKQHRKSYAWQRTFPEAAFSMRSEAQTAMRTVCADSLTLTFKVGKGLLRPVQLHFSTGSRSSRDANRIRGHRVLASSQ
jgi:hypothetical protein